METKEKLNELRTLKNRVLEKISCNTDPKFSKMVSLINENVSAILDESIEDGDIPNDLLDYMIDTLISWEKEIDEKTQQNVIGKMCWVYTVSYDSCNNIIVNVEQAEILKVEIFKGKMYYTSVGIYPECNIAFTEIDAYRKAKEHFEIVQHNMAVLIAHAEAKIKELEQNNN